MKASSTTPLPRLLALLPPPVFADAYRIILSAPQLDAPMAARALYATQSAWVMALMALRNALVRPFGLKGSRQQLPETGFGRIGFFPVLASAADEVLMGLDDRHLDFRLAVSVASIATSDREITVTTVVHTHNLLGRSYLRLIMPFHRAIARHTLQRAAQALSA